MVVRTLKLDNEHGLHARPAAKFVQLASRFQSRIFVEKDGISVNGKSIIGLMSLAAERTSEIILKIEGEDEQKAVAELAALIEGRFGEK